MSPSMDRSGEKDSRDALGRSAPAGASRIAPLAVRRLAARMTSAIYCAIDFGTSNSADRRRRDGRGGMRLVELEPG